MKQRIHHPEPSLAERRETAAGIDHGCTGRFDEARRIHERLLHELERWIEEEVTSASRWTWAG
jgi:hypothetical protein